MLDVLLKIVSILGIVLLALTIFFLVMLLLVLFFPVTYRVRGRKGSEVSERKVIRHSEVSGKMGDVELSAGLNWLFGLLRVRYAYPEPGILMVKLLWFKLYQAKLPPDSKKEEPSQREATPHNEASPQNEAPSRNEAAQNESASEDESASKDTLVSGETAAGPGEGAARQEEAQPQGAAQAKETPGEGAARQEEAQAQGAAQARETQGEDADNGFFKKFQNIKYTISGIYDKIKEIWKNISYYAALLQEENTRRLYVYAKQRIVKILKNIRPRHIRADILFGTGSPDTTGYVFGIYCMLYPVLGAKVLVTPDFERAVLEGRFDISGHITLFVLGVNLIRLMLDKKLRLFFRKLKKGAEGQGKALKDKAAKDKAAKDKAAKDKEF